MVGEGIEDCILSLYAPNLPDVTSSYVLNSGFSAKEMANRILWIILKSEGRIRSHLNKFGDRDVGVTIEDIEQDYSSSRKHRRAVSANQGNGR